MLVMKPYGWVCVAVFWSLAASAQVSVTVGGSQLTTSALSVAGSGPRTLLRRADVQSHLHLNMHQKAQLNEMWKSPEQMRVALTFSGQDAPDPDAARRQAEEQIRAQLGDRDAAIKAILTSEQWDRLTQLDLQWRGVLALADPQVAKLVELSSESQVEVVRIAAAYTATKTEVMTSLSQKTEDSSPDGTRRAIMMRIDTSELDKPFSPARKKLERAKQEAEKQINSVLTPDEKARWRKAIGEPFTFRADIKGLRF